MDPSVPVPYTTLLTRRKRNENVSEFCYDNCTQKGEMIYIYFFVAHNNISLYKYFLL